MKRFGLLLAGVCILVLSIVPFSHVHGAQDLFDDVCNNSSTNDASVCQDKNKNQTTNDNSIYGKNGIILKVTNIIALVVGFTAVIFVIIGGIRYVLSSGDPSNVSGAKNTIIYAIVGLVVVALARTIIGFVVGAL